MSFRSCPIALLAAQLLAFAEAQHVPHIVNLVPPHLAADVSPAKVDQLVVTFDRDMDTAGFAVCGGGPSFPKVQSTRWQNARTFVLEVQLEADRVYSMDLACAESAGFRSQDGGRLPPSPWRIATEGTALPEGAAATAATNLFLAIAERYSYRDRLGVDWNEVERTFHERLLGAKSGAAVALLASEVLALAQDMHITVSWQNATLPTCLRQTVGNINLLGLQKVLPKLGRVGRTGLLARTEDGIGYLGITSFAREPREDFERVLEALRSLHDCQALVLDVRNNNGGDEMLARRLAGYFVRGEKVYAAHRLRDPQAVGGFRERQDRVVVGNGEPEVFAGPVAVLMGPLDMSSCEAFLLMMQQAPQAILIGDKSYGSSGNPKPHALMAGLSIALPSWQALRPDGTSFEGEGLTPGLQVVATEAELAAGDPILDAALLHLRKNR